MSNSNFENGMYTLGYRFESGANGLGRWKCVQHAYSDDAKMFPNPGALLTFLEPHLRHEYEIVVTDPEFEYIRTKYWTCRNYLGELVFRYTHAVLEHR